MGDLAPDESQKLFIHRDYSNGMPVRFEKTFPRELEGRIDRESLMATIDRINDLYGQAEELNCSTAMEGCFACFTSYLLLCCMTTHYEKMARKVGQYIEEQNETVYRPRGIYLVDPIERGLRVIEIVVQPYSI